MCVCQLQVVVVPGESALAFYTARNTGDEPVTGAWNIDDILSWTFPTHCHTHCHTHPPITGTQTLQHMSLLQTDISFSVCVCVTLSPIRASSPSLRICFFFSFPSVVCTGVSTYNVTPQRAGIHFNKVQCFCFEEQRLQAGEQVDMPIFFYIDPDFVTDPNTAGVSNIILSYTFFPSSSEQGQKIKAQGAPQH